MKRALSYLFFLVLLTPVISCGDSTAKADYLMLWDKMGYQMTIKEFLKAYEGQLAKGQYAEDLGQTSIELTLRADESGLKVSPIAHFKGGKLVSVQLKGNRNDAFAAQSTRTYLKYMTDKHGPNGVRKTETTSSGSQVVIITWTGEEIEAAFDLEIDARTRTPMFDAWYYPVGKTRFY